MLPSSFRRLEKVYTALDASITFLKRRRKTEVPYLEEIRKDVEAACDQSLTLDVLSQIFFLFPDSYKMRRVVSRTDGNERVLTAIDINSDEIDEVVLQRRRDSMRDKLLSIVRTRHDVNHSSPSS
jgi:hypothetical protein